MIAINLIARQLEEIRKERKRAAVRRYRDRNPELCRARVRNYQKTPHAAAVRQEWRKNNRTKQAEYDRKAFLKSAYKITTDEYNALLVSQDGRCASCGDLPPANHARHGKLAVDHNHETGAVRGLLCARCNLALGLLKEDVSRIAKLANYMKTKG